MNFAAKNGLAEIVYQLRIYNEKLSATGAAGIGGDACSQNCPICENAVYGIYGKRIQNMPAGHS